MKRKIALIAVCLLFSAAPSVVGEDAWARLNAEALVAWRAKKYADVERCLRACLNHAKSFAKSDPRRFQSLRELAGFYCGRDRMADAEPLLRRALEVGAKSGRSRAEMASATHLLARTCRALRKRREAGALFRKALTLTERALGPTHLELAEILRDLARLHEDDGQYAKSEPLLRRALGIAEKREVPEGKEVTLCLTDLGGSYFSLARYREAKSLYERASRITEKRLGPQSLEFVITLSNLTIACRRLRLLEQAEAHCRRALKILETLGLQDHPQTASLLHTLGQVSESQGRIVDAEGHYKDSLRRMEKAFGPDHGRLASVLSDLAILLEHKGRFDQAEPLYRRSLAVESGAEDHPSRAKTMNALAVLLVKLRKFTEAEALIRKALAIQERKLGANHPDVSDSLANLGAVFRARGDLAQTLPLLERAHEIDRTVYGTRHPKVGTNLNNLATINASMGKHQKALKEWDESIRIVREALGEGHPSTLAYRINRASLFAELGRRGKALRELADCMARMANLREMIFATASERHKMVWVKNNGVRWERFFSLAVESREEHPETAIDALDAILEYKGAVLRASVQELKAAHLSGDPALEKLAGEVAMARRHLTTLALPQGPSRTSSDRDRKIKAAKAKLDALEENLARGSLPFARTHAQRKVDGRRLENLVSPDQAFVSFVRYRNYDFKAKEIGAARYLGVVVRRQESPILRDLGLASELDRAVGAFRQAIVRGNRGTAQTGAKEAVPQLRRLGRVIGDQLLRPLWDSLKDRRRWVLSPDGPLNALPFGILPVPNGKALLIDRHELTYVTSGKELASFGLARPTGKGAVLIANPDFDRDLTSPRSDGKRAPARSSDPFQKAWEPLPGTKAEAHAIRDLFRRKGVSVALKEGTQANKRALMDLRPPRYLHVATHGFYLPDQRIESPSGPGVRGLAGIAGSLISDQSNLAHWAGFENPLLRSGLVLAGANGKNGPLVGVATAQELASVNLWGTDLVVLSACDTGLGAITTGEGILGLRRAFLLSGAKTLVLSLWKIPDRDTKELMVEFYRRLLEGRRPGAALRAAKLMVRDRRKETGQPLHPFFWAAFILVGDPN